MKEKERKEKERKERKKKEKIEKWLNTIRGTNKKD